MGGMQDDVFTDAAGRFTLCNYQKTRAIQLFARTHDQASKLLVSLKSGTPELDNLEIVLHDGATVEGEVVDGFGRPIQGANIAPRWLLGGGEPSRPLPGRPRSLSVEDGSFRLSPLPPGEFSLELLPPGTNHYINEPFAQFRLAAGEEKTDVRLVYDEREGLELSGLVTDRQGTPLKEVNVHVSGPFTTQTRSDAQGRFRVGRLPEGSYTIHARGMGFSPYVEENVPAGTTKLRILLDPSARIKGKVVNVDTDSPVKEFEILVRHGVHGRYPWGANLMFTRISGTNGAFELDDIEIGDNTVVVQASGFVTKLEPVRDLQPAGDPLELTIALTPGAVIEGTVLEPDGSPAKEAFLFVGREPDTARWNWHAIAAAKTGASGAFRIDTLPQDAEMITAYLEGFAPTTRWIPLGDTMTIKLSKGSTIEGFVTADGRPLDDSYVHVTFPGRSDVKSHGYYTDADGLFRAGELAEGTARVRADMNLGDGLFHRRSIYTSVEVAENMLSSVTIDFSQTSAVLAGTILYNDRPVPNLGVNLNIESSDGNSYHYQVPVASDGSYAVYDIVPGIGKFQLLRQVDEDAHSGSPGVVEIDLFANGTIEHNVILRGPELNDAQYENPWRASNEAFWNAWLAHIQDLASE